MRSSKKSSKISKSFNRMGDHMKKMAIASNRVAQPFGIFSQAIKAGTLIFVSGQVAKDASAEVVGRGDIKAQTKQCLENLRHVLEAGGATLEDVVKLTV